jgi:hypothetical protein
LPPSGQDFPQAEIGLNAAIVAIAARQTVLERCAVRHVGGYGMAFDSGSRNNRVEGCELVDLAGGGVKIGHAGFGTWDQINEYRTILKCTYPTTSSGTVLSRTADAYTRGAVGVWIG